MRSSQMDDGRMILGFGFGRGEGGQRASSRIVGLVSVAGVCVQVGGDLHSGGGDEMVLKTEICRFSGSKIYPGRGIRFIRSDSQVFLFLNSKCKRYFHNRLKPSKLTWTALFRKQHKKDVHAEAIKKKRRTTNKPYSRSIVGASLEVIQKKRTEKTEVRAAAREAALREIKERIKKTKDEKKAKKIEVTSKPKSGPAKSATRAPQPKASKTGAGGKR